MLENPQTGALEPLDFTYLEEQVPELKRLDCRTEVLSIEPPIDSSAVSPKNWQELLLIIQKHYDAYDGFVILHGTDTIGLHSIGIKFYAA